MSEKKAYKNASMPGTDPKTFGDIYYKMIDEVEDYAIILLDLTGMIRNWNRGAEKIKQYTEVEAVGQNFNMFYLPEDREQHLPEKMLEQASLHGRAILEGWRVRKDGSHFWGSITITALHGDDGDLIGFSKVTRDLTEKKMSEDKLQKYLAELEAQNRELERFAYVASHDLQEPLRKIRTFIDVIANNPGDTERTNKYFNKIAGSAERMSELIKAILNYSRLGTDSLDTRAVDLNIVLKNVLDDFEVNIQEKGAVVSSERLPTVRGDELQLSQVFANIIGNSLKFSVDRPVIKISGLVVNNNQIPGLPSELVKGNYWDITFSDNGIGFDNNYAMQIFSLFQRLHGKKDYPGTGIGLALVKRVLENHNGFIRASGTEGKGAEFHIYLPVG